MPISAQHWHRTSVAIRHEHVDSLEAMLKGLQLRSVGELLNILVTADPLKVTAALSPFVTAAHAQRDAGKSARELAEKIKQLKDPELVRKLTAELAGR